MTTLKLLMFCVMLEAQQTFVVSLYLSCGRCVCWRDKQDRSLGSELCGHPECVRWIFVSLRSDKVSVLPQMQNPGTEHNARMLKRKFGIFQMDIQ